MQKQGSVSFDINLILSLKNGQTTRYFGTSSVFCLTVHLLNCAYVKGLIETEITPTNALASGPFNVNLEHLVVKKPHAKERLSFLIRDFLVSMNTLYGFIDPSTTDADLETYVQLTCDDSFSPQNLDARQTHQYFRISMICAIACANRARHEPIEQANSMAFYTTALTCVEDVTSEVSPESLQALLLLIVFCLFYPRKGDLWKLLDYACRLSIELGFHTELDMENENEDQKNLRRSTFWGLYAIERIVGQLLGRGADLPEAIITAQYPNPRPSQSVDEFETSQAITISHHYRLVYIRSKIYRDLYLSADMPVFPIDWYREQFNGLLAWRRDLHIEDNMPGVSTITCDVGYYSTICFLFQPVMLSLLESLKQDAINRDDPTYQLQWIPQDNYYAACELILAYERVIRSPHDSALSVYPMTFLSAHYIYLAGLTLMAHCLVVLERSIPVMSPFSDTQGESDPSKIDFSRISEISASCLILLTWCSDRWPEMVSMLNVYKRLSDRLVPALIRSGVL
jgi:Fungal specific transcription factor domain